MVGLKIHTTAKHKKLVVITETVTANNSEHSDEEEDDYDGLNECNHCFIDGVVPGYVTEDRDDLLRHIWTEHKENTAWVQLIDFKKIKNQKLCCYWQECRFMTLLVIY